MNNELSSISKQAFKAIERCFKDIAGNHLIPFSSKILVLEVTLSKRPL